MNLLFLYTDEQRYNTFAAYGNTQIEAPNLNALAEESTVFDQAYVTQPVCTPSRCTLLTGLTPHTSGLVQNNIPLADETPCLPEMLRDEFATAHHGKWHLGDEIYAQHGFDEWKATEDTYHNWYRPQRDQADRSEYHHWLTEKGYSPNPQPQLPPIIGDRFFRSQLMNLPEEHSRPAYLAGTADEFIRRNADNPWVLYVNFLEPHMPYHSARDDQYDPDGIPLPENFEAPSFSLRESMKRAEWYANGYGGQRLQTERDWQELTARYWGLVSLVDTHLGRIIQTLHETNQWDDTIIVFTSDHGDMMASRRMLGKGFMYEESSRVPLMIRVPGRKSQRVGGPVSQLDVVPTLLDLMNQPIPEHLEGRSLTGAMDAGNADRDVFIEWNSDRGKGEPPAELPEHLRDLGTPEQIHEAKGEQIRTVVTLENWKFNWSTTGEHQLFDLDNDPLELNNLAGDPAQADRIADCAERIRGWQKRTSDSVELPAPAAG